MPNRHLRPEYAGRSRTRTSRPTSAAGAAGQAGTVAAYRAEPGPPPPSKPNWPLGTEFELCSSDAGDCADVAVTALAVLLSAAPLQITMHQSFADGDIADQDSYAFNLIDEMLGMRVYGDVAGSTMIR